MRPALKISPSQLEEFRNLKVGNYELWGKTQDDFVLGLSKGFEPNAATSRGNAVHAILEGKDGFPCLVNDEEGYKINEPDFRADWMFSQDAYTEITSHRIPDAAFEVWGRWEGDVAGGDVRMNMRFDALEPCILHDFKTTGRPKKYRDFLDSIQWRCYLMALPEVQTVHYHVFQLPHDNPQAVLGWCKYEHFAYRREADNDATVHALLSELIAWAKDDERIFQALKMPA